MIWYMNKHYVSFGIMCSDRRANRGFKRGGQKETLLYRATAVEPQSRPYKGRELNEMTMMARSKPTVPCPRYPSQLVCLSS